MNRELLLETLQLVVDRLLEHPDFCGSIEGRRLQELRREIGRLRPNQEASSPPPRYEMRHLVTSTVSLPVDLDMALTVAAQRHGTTRNAMIETAIALVIKGE